jgi:succinyldiaminopimelate transaminase
VTVAVEGFVPPPYPYDRLEAPKAAASALDGGLVDLSIGTPCDPPPAIELEAMASSNAERGYPPSIGTAAYREAAAGWMERRLGVVCDPSLIAACVGTKELVAGMPHWLRLRRPDLDTVLYPAVSYPSYAMGAQLAGARAVPYASLEDIDEADARRALCLWSNVPGNPSGELADLGAAAGWGRAHGVPVLSDECYIEFTWDGPPRTILEHGTEGVLAVHSLSKRSNLAGARAGFYAGDAALVRYLSELRKHAGFMVPGPVQAAAVAAWGDDAHVDEQRERYRARIELVRSGRAPIGGDAPSPAGAFPVGAPAPGGDAWGLTQRLAEQGGALVSPGELYGAAAADHVRLAVVQPDDRIELVVERLAKAAAG